MRLTPLLLILSCSTGTAPMRDAADVLYVNGTIYTVDAKSSVAEAIAVRAGRIVAVGTAADCAVHKGPTTEVVDLGGACVVPGLIDAHAHFGSLGSIKRSLDARKTRSYAELIELVKAKAAKAAAGEWILGGRWDNATWGMKDLPTHHELSKAVPDVPVLLSRVDGHAALANRKAMELAGVTKDTPDPAGGDVVKDADGEPTGIFIDNAISVIRKAVKGRGAPYEDLLLDAQAACVAVGLTGIHDMGVSPDEAATARKLADAGKLKIRLYLALSGGRSAPDYFAEHKPIVHERVTFRSCKMYIDGAMGSRGAWLLAPYADKPANDQGKPNVGLNVEDPKLIREVATAALKHGWQLCVHAIGDRGNREVLDAFEAAIRETGAKDHRLRIEHCQCVALDDIPRFAKLGVIPSMQPTHATSDMRWAEDRVGKERLKGCYAWRRFLDAGCRIAGGSDFPVEGENPILGFFAAVTRQDEAGKPEGGWTADQLVTRAEALRMFTIDAAYAGFEEKEKGSLEPGKLADFVVFDRDITKCAPKEILGAKVARTVIGGEVVHRAP